MSLADPSTLAAATDLLHREARYLDDGAWDAWVDLYTDDAFYWVPTHRSLADPGDGLSHMLDDKQLMKTRISRLGNPRIWSPEPWPTTCHLVSNVFLGSHGDLIRVHSSQIVVEYRKRDYGEEDQRVFGCLNTHDLRATPEGLRIVMKRIDLINAESALNAVAIPF
jgi:3-phenylpropionate/cinnamic acid dioxygenase small subunit